MENEKMQLEEQNQVLMKENHWLLEANQQAIQTFSDLNYELKKKNHTIEDQAKEIASLKEQISKLQIQNQRDRNSWNWRIGAFLLWLPKKIYYFFKRQ